MGRAQFHTSALAEEQTECLQLLISGAHLVSLRRTDCMVCIPATLAGELARTARSIHGDEIFLQLH